MDARRTGGAVPPARYPAVNRFGRLKGGTARYGLKGPGAVEATSSRTGWAERTRQIEQRAMNRLRDAGGGEYSLLGGR
jgi:hypothetical protein